MAKFVIAGPANCPYFAKIEVLAHTMNKVLPDFQFRTMLIVPTEWKGFVIEICRANDWIGVKRSPIIWREPLEFGGPKLFFGSFNEFQEYAFTYYGIENNMPSSDMLKLAKSNLHNRIKDAVADFTAITNLIVTILFARSPITYYFLPFLSDGELSHGYNQINLRLYDLPKEGDNTLVNIAKELEDTSSPKIKTITICNSLLEAVEDAHIIIIFPTKTVTENLQIDPFLRTIGSHIYSYAGDDFKVLVVFQCFKDTDMNMCNMRMALSLYIPPENILAVSGVVLQRAKVYLAEKMDIHVSKISNFLFWGFNCRDPSCFHLDITHATVKNSAHSAVFGANVKSEVSRLIPDNQWLRKTLPQITVTHLLSKIPELTETSANAMSMASVAAHILKLWQTGTGGNEIYSVCAISQGWYGVDGGIFFNFPVMFNIPGSFTVLTDLEMTNKTNASINHISKNYIKHMIVALIERSERISKYVEVLNTDPKDDEPAAYPLKLTESFGEARRSKKSKKIKISSFKK